MELNTASSVISHISKMERESAGFYEEFSEAYSELKEVFLSFAEENKKNERTVKRAYYSVVSDALETNFSFKGLRSDFTMPVSGKLSSAHEVLDASIEMEKGIEEFYRRAAGLSKALLADVPRAMERVAKHRVARVERLREIRRALGTEDRSR